MTSHPPLFTLSLYSVFSLSEFDSNIHSMDIELLTFMCAFVDVNCQTVPLVSLHCHD